MSHFLANRARLSVLEFPSLFSSGYALFHFPYPASPLLAALTKTTGVCTNSLHSGPPHLLVATCQSPQHLRALFSYSSALFYTLLHFFALLEDLTLLFSNGSALFAKNTRVGVGVRPWFAPFAPSFEGIGFCEGNNPARSSKKLPRLLSSSPTILRDAESWSTSENSAEEFVTASDSFDLIVIGCAPAGEKGGAQAASFGKRCTL